MKNIYEIPYGFRVIIHRPELTYRAFVKFGDDRAAALKKAQALRDEFFAVHGEFGISGQRPRSNTGISGISEQTKWFHGQPKQCFQVTCGHPKKGMRRFYYQTFAGRELALNRAVAHRQKLEAHYA